MCVEAGKEYNPCFLEGTFNIDNWQRIKTNVKKPMIQGKKIPVHFWSIWSMIFTVFKAMMEQWIMTNLGKEVTPSVKKIWMWIKKPKIKLCRNTRT